MDLANCPTCNIPFKATKKRDGGETFIGYCGKCQVGHISISNKVADYHVAEALANRDLMTMHNGSPPDPTTYCSCGNKWSNIAFHGNVFTASCDSCQAVKTINFTRVITCSKCGSPDVIAVNFDHDISLCAACMPPLKTVPIVGGFTPCDDDLRDLPEPKARKVGCKKCDYTGFAFGKIPCECSDGN
jgi:hypothetical protein